MKPIRLVLRISKAVEQPSLFQVGGDGSIRNNPELTPRKLVDKRGVVTTRYVRPHEPERATTPTAPPPPPAASQPEGYEDTGEHIPRSRKELAQLRAELRDRPLELDDLTAFEEEPGVAYEVVTLEQVAGKGVLENARDRGVSPGAAFLLTKLWGVMLKRPQGDTPRDRRLYVLGVQRVMSALEGVTSVQGVLEAMETLANERNGFRVPSDRLEEYYALRGRRMVARVTLQQAQRAHMPQARGVLDSEPLKRAREESRAAAAAYAEFAKEMQALDAASEYPAAAALGQLGDRFRQYVGLRSWRDSGSTVKTRQKHVDAARRYELADDWSWSEPRGRKRADAGGGEQERKPRWERAVPEEVLRAGGQDTKFTSDSLLETFRLRGVQYGNWMDAEASREHTQHAGDALTDLAGVLGVTPAQVSLNGRLGLAFGARGGGHAAAHYEPGQTVINLTKTRGGGSLAHEWAHFLDNVIARVSHAGDGGHMTYATNALLTPDAKGANLLLGEHLSEEITAAMTEVREAIYSGDNRGTRKLKRHVPEGRITRPHTTAEELLSDAGGDPNAAMRAYLQSDMMRAWLYEPRFSPKLEYQRAETRARRMADYLSVRTGQVVTYELPGPPDKATSNFAATGAAMGGYWARPVELFARAFESWVSDTLTANGQVNTYLVAGVSEEHAVAWARAVPVLGDATSVYPRGEERTRINAAISKLVAALRGDGFYAKAARAYLYAAAPRRLGMYLAR